MSVERPIGTTTLLVSVVLAVLGPREGRAEQTSADQRLAAAAPAFRRGFLLMPFAGAHLPLGDASIPFNLGFRTGGIFGRHVSPFLSLNGELTVDVLTSHQAEQWTQRLAHTTDLAFSPLFHLATERGVIVMGPRIGVFRFSSSTAAFSKDETAHGLTYGLNFGVFGAIGNTAIGALFGYTARHATEACTRIAPGPDMCLSGGSDFHALSVTAAALF